MGNAARWKTFTSCSLVGGGACDGDDDITAASTRGVNTVLDARRFDRLLVDASFFHANARLRFMLMLFLGLILGSAVC
jgi:hypothetical protein